MSTDFQPVLHFSGHRHRDLALHRGVNGLCRDPDFDRGLVLARDGARSLLDFCFDERGVWLHVAESGHGVHVNGRPVQSLALLHAGDRIHWEGSEMQLVDASERAGLSVRPALAAADANKWPKPLLRGICGPNHGRSFVIAPLLRVGEGDADIRIDGANGTLAELGCDVDGCWINVLDGSAEVLLNGQPARLARLRGGDQLAFRSDHRYLLELPSAPALPASASGADSEDTVPSSAAVRTESRNNISWLLLAAVLIALALAALLWFGVK
ncbi:MAG: FHA domain-containing protein [Pseudomonadota bacterium]|nr:FHA domain-containing protein [Pseudomonadota bacterium]